jgi:hypothetical protein
MENRPNLTAGYPPILAQQIRKTHEGMAHFAATGPFGATCGACEYLGYWRKFQNSSGDTVAAKRVGGCAKFFELTGKHGAVVPASAEACRYFKLRDESKPHHREQKETHDEQ